MQKLMFFRLHVVSVMMPLAKQCAFEEPSIETISGENVLTWPHVVRSPYIYVFVVTISLCISFFYLLLPAFVPNLFPLFTYL